MYLSRPALQRKLHLCILRKRFARPQSKFPHSCVCELFIYSQDRSTYFPAAEYADRSWEYINRSQTKECGNWTEAVQFLYWEYLFRTFGIFSLQCVLVISFSGHFKTAGWFFKFLKPEQKITITPMVIEFGFSERDFSINFL